LAGEGCHTDKKSEKAKQLLEFAGDNIIEQTAPERRAKLKRIRTIEKTKVKVKIGNPWL
jgi:hypothetical protein